MQATATGETIGRHPRGLYVLFFTEMWERFSYYGMRALLVLFMTAAIAKGGLNFDDKTATAIYGLYTSFVYLTALPGGWIADRLLGARRSVWYGGIIIAAGHFSLAIPSINTFYIGLLLIVMGTALLKPNISVIVGELYGDDNARRDAGFTIFYMGINLGAMIGSLVCGWLGEKVNWHYGFGAAGVGMLLGLTQYRLSARHLGEAGMQPKGYDPKTAARDWSFVGIAVGAIALIAALGLARVIRFDPVRMSQRITWIIAAVGLLYFAGIFLFGGLNRDEIKKCVVLIVLLAACAIFFSGFEQAGSSLNLFALDFTNRNVGIFQKEIPASWFQTINPIFIITFAPVMASLWVALGRRSLDPSIPAKFALGLILLGLGFLVMVVASRLVIAGGKVLPVWLISTYFIHTIAELCLSPVGLSAVTKLAPKRFVGQMMGLWFLATSLGNLLAGLFAGEITGGTVEQMPALYMRIVMIAAGAGVVLLMFTKPIKRLLGAGK